jgi:serine/threonine protein kinase
MSDAANQAKSIFLDAFEKHAPEQWPAFLDQACAGDASLRAEVEKPLRARSELGSFHEAPRSNPVGTIDDPDTERPGTVIGPYKLMEQIGEGGMGLVFVAEQQQPIRRKVAFKVIKPGMGTRQVVARFEAERQALALMDHPNIAKVLDGGATASGLPYFVMELVKGVPITEYCDRQQLTPRERLALFLHVCQAIQHAHQKGIIHRDVKPSNVLVVSHDGTPVVKVIDFGVAKAVGQQLTDKTIYTQFAQLVGTPLYMSPEQAGQSSLDVDTRADIYALGVLLYELLTGKTPFDKERFKQAAYDEICRIIREEEPPKPSTHQHAGPGGLDGFHAAEERPEATEPSLPRRAGQDRDEGAGEGPQPPLRHGQRPGARRGALSARRAGAGLSAVGGLPAAEVRAAEPRPADGRGGARVGPVGRGRGRRLGAPGPCGPAGQLGRPGRADPPGRRPAGAGTEVAEARAAAERAEAALAGTEADDATQRRLDEARSDLDFVARLERIRQDHTTFIEGKFNDRGAALDYARAFREYGVDMEGLPTDEAVAGLRAKPALALPVAAALDNWVSARRSIGETETSWKPLVAVARGLDRDPLRDRLRTRWGQPVTPETQATLLQLAESIDVKAESPTTIQVLAETLTRAKQSDAAIRIMRKGQSAILLRVGLRTRGDVIGVFLAARPTD